MCGRTKLPEDLSELKQDLRIKWDRLGIYEPRYNVAPTTLLPIVTSAGGERTIEWMRWGLIPSWAKDAKIGYSTFNARADSVATKPTFRGAWRLGRRCLVVTGGFYEWRRDDKQPFCISLGNNQPMLLAGLWDEWHPAGKDPLRTFTIITTEANGLVAPLHNRMPVIIGAEDWGKWLGDEPGANPAELLKPFAPERLTMWPVDRRIGNVKNQGRELAEPMFLG